MSRVMLTFITIISFVLVSVSGQTTSLWLPLSQCTMNYQKPTSNTIVFLSCIVDTLGDSNWNKCFRLCCSRSLSTFYNIPSIEALSYCEVVNQPEEEGLNYTTISIIAMGVLFGAILIGCILCFACKKYRNKRIMGGIVEEIKDVEW